MCSFAVLLILKHFLSQKFSEFQCCRLRQQATHAGGSDTYKPICWRWKGGDVLPLSFFFGTRAAFRDWRVGTWANGAGSPLSQRCVRYQGTVDSEVRQASAASVEQPSGISAMESGRRSYTNVVAIKLNRHCGKTPIECRIRWISSSKPGIRCKSSLVSGIICCINGPCP